MALRAGHVSAGPLEGPHRPTIVAAKYLKTKAFLSSEMNIFLWVDVLGLKIVDQASRKVISASTYNEISSWTVDKDSFRVKVIIQKPSGGGSGSPINGSDGGKQRLKERVYITGNAKALQLKEALEETVKLYLQEPDLIKELRELATDLDVGELMPLDVADQVEPFGSGEFVDPEMAATNGAASRRHRRKSGQKMAGQIQKPMSPSLPSSPPNSYPSTPDNASAPVSKWQQPSSMKGFPCKLIVEASEGASAGDKGKIASVITTISVLLIVKRDGLHVLKSNAVGERRQAIFFAYDTILGFQKTDDEFRFSVETSMPATTTATRRSPHHTLDRPQTREAMYRFVTDPGPISAVVEQYSGQEVVSSTTGEPLSMLRKHMFESVQNRQSGGDSDEAYDGVELSDDEEHNDSAATAATDDVTEYRKSDLLHTLQQGMAQVEKASSEDALLERCMEIMLNLNRFISAKGLEHGESDSDYGVGDDDESGYHSPPSLSNRSRINALCEAENA